MRTNKTNFFHDLPLPSDEVLANCIHCGMCLQACPTYQITFDEKSSPRGRIRMIKAVAEGNLEITETFVREMNFCLDCQACETACPAGVKYGSLVEAVRVQIDDSKYNSLLKRKLKRFIFRHILPYNNRIKSLALLLRFYQRIGLQKLIRKTKLLKLISEKLYEIEKLSPKISDFFSDEIFPDEIQPKGIVRFRVIFPSGCLMNVMFSDINKDTIEVLLENNCEVIFPKNQTCCGSMQAHNGDIQIAIEQAKRNIDQFMKYDFDYIIINSAG
ncbi:MAG: (Fe-S)-binding protein, partial [Ignavibacteria bacterium]|nr:(Fe-S)-binding protein [Ignavibacteria bacterium]